MSLDNNMSWSPEDYAETAVVALEAGEEMLSRLDVMTIKPAVVLDLGCGASKLTQRLTERYPAATLISLDVDIAALEYHKTFGSKRRLASICSDASLLPLASNSIDFIFANFLLPWCADFQNVLQECKRVLRPEGLFMLTALGPDTLRQCQASLIPGLIDMHDLGDMLLQMGWSDPVLDVCSYTTTYRDKEKMKKELYASGMLHAQTSMPDVNELNYEVIHAHAFKAAPKPKIDNAERVTKIPVSEIVRKMV